MYDRMTPIPRPRRHVLGIFRKVRQGVDYIHNRGLVLIPVRWSCVYRLYDPGRDLIKFQSRTLQSRISAAISMMPVCSKGLSNVLRAVSLSPTTMCGYDSVLMVVAF